ncbi:MAG TPA: outer membrane beta-barrel protein [Chryseolinea sp.]
MQKIPVVISLVAFCCLGTLSVNAQKKQNFLPGFIVLRGDTTRGFVQVEDHMVNIKECTFKETGTGTAKTYSPEELDAYGIQGRSFYHSAMIQTEYSTDRKVFLDCVVQGKASFFVYRDRFFIIDENGTKELIEVKDEVQKNGKSVIVKKPLYKSVLQQKMEACSTIHEKLVNTTLTQKSLLALFRDYASCTGDKAVVYDETKQKAIRTRYGFTAGVLVANLDLEAGSFSQYIFAQDASGEASVTFTPSFFMDFGISKQLDLNTGLTWYYTKNELHAESSETNLTHDFTLEASRIEVPLLLKWTFINGGVKCHVKGGAGLDLLTHYENKLTVSTTSTGFLLSEYTNDLEKSGFIVNGMGGVGVEFSLGNRAFLVEGTYSKSGSLVNSGTHARLDAFRFGFGMFF